MKVRDYFIALTLTLVVLVTIVASNHEKTYSDKSENKSVSETNLTVSVVKVEIDKTLLDKIDELTRLNVWLEMENAGMHDYIVGMGKTWDRWASENDFPKDGEKE